MEEYTGEKLKQKREAALLTQTELAEKIGVTKLSIWHWENGKAKPFLKNIRTMKEFFKNQGEKE